MRYGHNCEARARAIFTLSYTYLANIVNKCFIHVVNSNLTQGYLGSRRTQCRIKGVLRVLPAVFGDPQLVGVEIFNSSD